MDYLTTDTFFNGRIQVRQPSAGYRFSIDAVLIAGCAKPRSHDTVLDLGTGCGVIPMILAYRYAGIRVYGIEVQPQLAELAALNIEENGLKNRVKVLCMDMKMLQSAALSGPVDLVVSNPPFRKAESGRINPNRQRAIARHEIMATLVDVVETACRMLRASGRFVSVYPAQRLADMLIQMRSVGIEPKFVRTIHSGKHTEAKLILVEGSKGARPGIKIGPPLIIYNQDGSYSGEVKQMFLP